MFVARRLVMPTACSLLHEPIIRREVLSEILRSVQAVEDMHVQAQAILAAAEEQAARRIEQAERDFWQRAEVFLQAWEAERERDLQAMANQIDFVLQQAWSQLLGEVGQPQRVAVLLDHLLRSQQRPLRAKLHCHPEHVQTVAQWLKGQPCEMLWTIQPDQHLEPGQICLATDTGQFDLDWKALQGVAGLLAG